MKFLIAMSSLLVISLGSTVQAEGYDKYIPDNLKKTCKNCKITSSSRESDYNDDIYIDYQLQCDCKDFAGQFHHSSVGYNIADYSLKSGKDENIINCNGKLANKNGCKLPKVVLCNGKLKAPSQCH